MTFKRVEDDGECKHQFLVGPTRQEGQLRYGHCDECRREVAIELDENGRRTGSTWLIQRDPAS